MGKLAIVEAQMFNVQAGGLDRWFCRADSVQTDYIE